MKTVVTIIGFLIGGGIGVAISVLLNAILSRFPPLILVFLPLGTSLVGVYIAAEWYAATERSASKRPMFTTMLVVLMAVLLIGCIVLLALTL